MKKRENFHKVGLSVFLRSPTDPNTLIGSCKPTKHIAKT